MRTKLRGKFTLLFLTFAVLLAIPAVALADNIQDSVADNVTSALQLTAGDANSKPTAEVRVVGNNAQQDPDDGCNFDVATESLTIKFTTPTGVTATALDGATATPGEMKFTVCGVDQTVQLSASSSAPAGNYTVTANIVNNSTGGTFVNQVSIPITVSPPPDSTPPVITPDVQGTLGDNGWYTSNVSVSWSVTDDQSVISSKSGCDTTNITLDQTAKTYTCTATSTGGTDSKSVTIKRDATPPTINDDGTTQTPNGAGWYNTAVSNDFSASDDTSGLANSGDANFSKSSGATQGSAVKINSGSVSDNAGNTNAGIDSASFKIDLTKPTVSVTGVSNGATYTLGSVPTAGCSTADSLSGVKTDASLQPLSGGPVGSVTATCSGASDNAGNTNSASVTYNVHYAWTGFFRPVDNPEVLNSVKAGSAIPVKFSLAGNQGLNIFAAGSPTSQKITCDSSDPVDVIEETVTAGGSSLSYDASTDQYNYVWKSDKAWAGTCRQLSVKLADGTTHVANFKFLK